MSILHISSLGAFAQTSNGVCDEELLRNARGRQGYRRIDDQRCEGLYASNVSGTVLWVAALTESFEYDPTNAQPLVLRWRAPVDGAIHVRAQSIKRDFYYRMDAAPADSSSYEWETSMLRGQGVQTGDIGLLAWTVPPGSERGELVVPITAGQGDVRGTGEYELVLVPNVRLRELYISVAPADSVGHRPTTGFLKQREPLGRRLYAAQRPQRIPLTGLGEPGIYFLEVSALRSDGRPVAISPMWFYHSGS